MQRYVEPNNGRHQGRTRDLRVGQIHRQGALRLRRTNGFAFEQRSLALNTPAVTRQFAVGLHRTVAGNGHRQNVAGAGLLYGAFLVWCANLFGQ